MPRYPYFIPKPGGVTNITFDTSSKSVGLVLGADKVTNGAFASDTGWTKGTGWTISGGVAVATACDNTALEQNISAVVDEVYELTYTVTVTGGKVTPQIGGVNGALRSSTGTYRDVIKATTTGNLKFVAGTGADALTGNIDNVTVKKVSKGMYASLVATQACYFKLGNETVTVSSSDGQYLPANVILNIGINNQYTYVAVIQSTASGFLTVSELEEPI